MNYPAAWVSIRWKWKYIELIWFASHISGIKSYFRARIGKLRRESQFIDEKHQSLKQRASWGKRWKTLPYHLWSESETWYCFAMEHIHAPEKRKQHKLECFVGEKQFLMLLHHQNNFLSWRPPAHNEAARTEKGFCFESKQAPSMKMVISHHFSFWWKTFMFRIIMWWRKNFAVFFFRSVSFRFVLQDARKMSKKIPFCLAALKHIKLFFNRVESDEGRCNAKDDETNACGLYWSKDTRARRNECWIKLFPNYEKWIRHEMLEISDGTICYNFISLSKRRQTRNIRLKSESLRMPLKLFPENRFP